jgi:sulfite reductase (NADPH) flavoprotein alpha-component
MPVLPAIPASAAATPMADDQLVVLRDLLARASPAQRQFMSGYVAGFQAALDPQTALSGQPAAAPASVPTASAPPASAPPAARPALTILYATESGNAEALAGAARKAAAKQGFAARLLDMADADPATLAASLAGNGRLLVIASTWGEGDPPQRAEAFYAALMDTAAPRLDGVRFAVLALGDRAYVNFCETGRRLDARLEALGASRAAPLAECDLDYAAPAQSWTTAILRSLAEEAAAQPMPATIQTAPPPPGPLPPRSRRSSISTAAAPRSKPTMPSCRLPAPAFATSPAMPSASRRATIPR